METFGSDSETIAIRKTKNRREIVHLQPRNTKIAIFRGKMTREKNNKIKKNSERQKKNLRLHKKKGSTIEITQMRKKRRLYNDG